MLSGETFGRSKTYQKIVSGQLTWHCEWCGEKLVQDDVTDAEEMLDQAREHGRGCRHHPRFFSADAATDEKEVAKGSLGRCCEWCGEEKIDKNILGSGKRLKQTRHHSMNCMHNPLVSDK